MTNVPIGNPINPIPDRMPVGVFAHGLRRRSPRPTQNCKIATEHKSREIVICSASERPFPLKNPIRPIPKMENAPMKYKTPMDFIEAS